MNAADKAMAIGIKTRALITEVFQVIAKTVVEQ
jgi:hypothetical protein